MKTEKLFMNPALIEGMNFFIRTEINGTENLKKKNETKHWFFERKQ